MTKKKPAADAADDTPQDFALGAKVKLAEGGAEGVVIGRNEHTEQPTQFLVRYKDEGGKREGLFGGSMLEEA